MKVWLQVASIMSISSLVFVFSVTPAQALTIPTFPVCANPQGAVKVAYSEGTHGIVGSANTYTGKDTVYTLSDATLMQCFCPIDGSGIQTNWWKVDSLSEEDIAIAINQGWTMVPTGSVWGLDDAPYLTKNSSYQCISNGTGGSSDNNSSSSSNSNTGGGQILATSTNIPSVSGLATTGNILAIISLLGIGSLLTTLGIFLKKS